MILLFQFKKQLSSTHYLLVREAITIQWFSVKRGRLDEVAACILSSGCQDELLSVFQIQRHLVETWRTYIIIRCARTNRVETQGGEYIPCRHLTRIIIARQTARGIIILRLQDVVHPLLGLLRSSGR